MKAIKFKKDHIGMILTKRKTETRRMVRPDLDVDEVVEAWVDEPGSELPCRFCGDERSDPEFEDQTCRFCRGTGMVPALPFATLRVVSIYDQAVGEFSDADAEAEGYSASDELWDVLDSIYGEVPLGLVMYVVRFTLEVSLVPATAQEAAAAFERRRVQSRSY